MALLFFILGFFLVKPVFAETQINIKSVSNRIGVGSTFAVDFEVVSSDIGSTLNYKFFGGVGESKTQIQSAADLYWTGTLWSNFPSFSINSSELFVIHTTAYIKSDSPGGQYNLYVKLNNDSSTTSPGFVINVLPICNYTYSSWSDCSSSGTKTRTATLTSTTECVGTSDVTTQTCTYDATITNPASGITMTEVMPYTDPEWVEIYNSNDYPVKLVSWKIEDIDGNVKNIDNLSISAKGYAIFEPKSLIFDNNSNEKIIFRNQDNKIINEFSYSKGLLTIEKSWSSISGSWCQASITKGYENVNSCYVATTPTPSPSPTPTPDQGKYTSSDTATESAIIEPATESSFITPTTTLSPSPAENISSDDSPNNTNNQKYLPLILIITGGLLLTSPLIISKLKK